MSNLERKRIVISSELAEEGQLDVLEPIHFHLLSDGRFDTDGVLDPSLRDMVSAALGSGNDDDFVQVTQLTSGRTQVICIRPKCDQQWLGEIVRADATAPDISWTFASRTGQVSSIEESYGAFSQWLGPDALLFLDLESPSRGQLVVKVDAPSLWFLRFPLSVFNQLGIGPLKRYRGVDWIVTGKTFTAHCAEREQIRRELADLDLFLSNTVIVLNTYGHHATDARCEEATAMLLRIFRLLHDIRIGASDRRLDLRWYLNPSYAELRALLLDPSTWYFFADFEASSGTWETGEGDSLSWDRDASARAIREPFQLDGKGDDVSHIRLIRVFHCNTVFDPYIDREPASTGTIVRDLLTAGAWRVEGGMTKELYLEYLESLSVLLLENEAFRFVVRCKALEAGIDLGTYTDRLRDVLNVNT